MKNHTGKYIRLDSRIVEIIENVSKLSGLGNRGRSKAVSKAVAWYVERLNGGQKYPDLEMKFHSPSEKCYHLTIENNSLSSAENYLNKVISKIIALRNASTIFKVKSTKEKLVFNVNLKNLAVKAVFYYHEHLVRGENEII